MEASLTSLGMKPDQAANHAQCKIEDGTCDEMAEEIEFMGRVRKEDAVRFKFVIDVDG